MQVVQCLEDYLYSLFNGQLLLYGMCRQHLTSASAEANAQTILLAVSTNDDLIVILQEFTRLAALQLKRLGAAPAQLQE